MTTPWTVNDWVVSKPEEIRHQDIPPPTLTGLQVRVPFDTIQEIPLAKPRPSATVRRAEEILATTASDFRSPFVVPQSSHAHRWPYRREVVSCELDLLDASSSDDDDAPAREQTKKRKAARSLLRRQLVQIKKFAYGVLGLDPNVMGDRHTMIAWSANTNATIIGYGSMLRKVAEAGHPMTREGISAYTEQRVSAGTLASKSVYQYKNAGNYLYRVLGQDGNGSKERFALISKGLSNMAKLNPRTRGAITQDMIEELIELPWLNSPAMIWMRDAFILLAATGVRQNQLINMTAERCRFVKNSSEGKIFAITVDANHKGRRGTSNFDNDTECHVTNPVFGHHVDRIHREALAREDDANKISYMSKEWTHTSAAKARKALKRAASELHWNPELSWVLHGTRDGAAVDAFMKTAPLGEKKALLKIQERTGHVTLNMLRHYAIPNDERVKYQRMKRDDAMLRLTGVVCDTLETRYSNERLGSMLKVCAEESCFDHGSWRAVVKEREKLRRRRGY